MKTTRLSVLLACAAASAGAQSLLRMPEPSPRASVSERVGITTVTVEYGRPAAAGRVLWGGVVPYGLGPAFPGFGNGKPMPWRAGANENTTVTLDRGLLVEGKPLAAGVYGLHMIPAQNRPWTVIFNRNSTSWGSFFYEESEDALRVEVTPRAGPAEERLRYEFVDQAAKMDAVTLALRWGELAVPIRLKVADLPESVMESARADLRSGRLTVPGAFREAALYAFANKVNQEEALRWADQAPRGFGSVAVKAGLLKQLGRAPEAEALLKPALETASEAELNAFGYQLLGLGERDEALAMFELNVKRHPEAWNPLDSLAEVHLARGNKAEAGRYYRLALEKLGNAPGAEGQRQRINRILAGL